MDGLEEKRMMSKETIVPLDGFSDLDMELISLAAKECRKVLITMSEEDALEGRHVSLSDLVITKLYLSVIDVPPTISGLYCWPIGRKGFWK